MHELDGAQAFAYIDAVKLECRCVGPVDHLNLAPGGCPAITAPVPLFKPDCRTRWVDGGGKVLSIERGLTFKVAPFLVSIDLSINIRSSGGL